MSDAIHPASMLIDAAVTGLDGGRIGAIRDVLIDGDGVIVYVALAYGGVLGVGEKLVALPWSAITIADDGRSIAARLSAADLRDEPGFDKDAWPDIADPRWRRAPRG